MTIMQSKQFIKNQEISAVPPEIHVKLTLL